MVWGEQGGAERTSFNSCIMRERKLANMAGAPRTFASQNMNVRSGLVARVCSSKKAAHARAAHQEHQALLARTTDAVCDCGQLSRHAADKPVEGSTILDESEDLIGTGVTEARCRAKILGKTDDTCHAQRPQVSC